MGNTRGAVGSTCTLRPLLTAICFAFVPQRYTPEYKHSPLPVGVNMCYLLTPPRVACQFLFRVVPTVGGMRMFQCPRWVSTLQAAELWGWVQGIHLAAFMKWPRVFVGNDSTVARCQIQGQRGAVFCFDQQRVLRALFRLRR